MSEHRSRTDIGFLFSDQQEMAGLFDLLPKAERTIGNGLKYSLTEWKGLSIVAVETGTDPEQIQKAADSMYRVFRPLKIVSAGFAVALVPELKKEQIVIPDRIVRLSDRKSIDFRSRAIQAPDNSNKSKSENTENVFQQFYGFVFDRLKIYPNFGTILTVEKAVHTTEKKTELHSEYNASCYDQTCFPAGKFCVNAGIPFLPIRIIAESLNEQVQTSTGKMQQATSTAERFGMFFGALTKKKAKSVLEYCSNATEKMLIAEKLGKTILAIIEPIEGSENIKAADTTVDSREGEE